MVNLRIFNFAFSKVFGICLHSSSFSYLLCTFPTSNGQILFQLKQRLTSDEVCCSRTHSGTVTCVQKGPYLDIILHKFKIDIFSGILSKLQWVKYALLSWIPVMSWSWFFLHYLWKMQFFKFLWIVGIFGYISSFGHSAPGWSPDEGNSVWRSLQSHCPLTWLGSSGYKSRIRDESV